MAEPAPGDYLVRQLAAAEMGGPLLAGVLAAQAAALGYQADHPRIQARGPIVRRHCSYPGFRAFGAFDAAGQLVGFCYGFDSFAGDWWREQVCAALDEADQRYWFGDGYEFVELHVRPEAQGLRLGSRLHDALLEGVPRRTALLSTMRRSAAARRLYARRQWRTVIEDFRFTNDPTEPFSILGRELRAPAA